MKIDLRKCKPGDQLKCKDGEVLTYVGCTDHPIFPHMVRYQNGYNGARTNDGRLWSIGHGDRDIVAIIRKPTIRRQPTALDRIRAITRRRNWHDWEKVSAIKQVLKEGDGK